MSAPLVTPRTPNSAARLKEEERKVVTQSRQLLASDRLELLAVRDRGLGEEAKRASEALTWLDKRLDADLRAAALASDQATEANRRIEAETRTYDPLPLFSTTKPIKPYGIDLAMEAKGFKSSSERLKEKIQKRNMGIIASAEVTIDEAPQPRAEGESALSQEAQRRLAGLSVGEGDGSFRDVHAGNFIEDLWSQRRPVSGGPAVEARPYAELASLSAAARQAAAPHISGVYEQIFMDDVEPVLGGDGFGNPDEPAVVTLILDEDWEKVNGGENAIGDPSKVRRSHYERALLTDLADAMNVPIHRFRVLEIRPGPSWYRTMELHVELQLMPDPHGAPPSCAALASELKKQASNPQSGLREKEYTRRALRVSWAGEGRVGEDRDPETARTKYNFSLLRGGIVASTPRYPQESEALLAKNQTIEKPQHVNYVIDQVLPEARRNSEGFWVDTQMQKPLLPKPVYYGTYNPDQAVETPRLARQWRIFAAGFGVLFILVAWILYLNYLS